MDVDCRECAERLEMLWAMAAAEGRRELPEECVRECPRHRAWQLSVEVQHPLSGNMQKGQWPDPQYPPVTCTCGKTVPEREAVWGFCPECFAERDEDLT